MKVSCYNGVHLVCEWRSRADFINDMSPNKKVPISFIEACKRYLQDKDHTIVSGVDIISKATL